MKSKNLHVDHASAAVPRWVWAPPALWMVALFIASAIPGTAYPRVQVPMSDKMVHILIYLPLGATFARALGLRFGAASRARIIFLATSLAALFGVSDEVHQAFVPNRSPDVRDLMADLIGACLGAFLWTWWRSRSRAQDGSVVACVTSDVEG